MKLILVVSLAVALGLGMSGTAQAHGYGPPGGGAVYWNDGGYYIGVGYAAPYWVPPRYSRGYKARPHGHRYGYDRSYRKGYRKGYKKGRHRSDRYRGHRHYRDH